jgi:hypothetical protein
MVNKLGRISKDLNISLECKRNNNITLKATWNSSFFYWSLQTIDYKVYLG